MKMTSCAKTRARQCQDPDRCLGQYVQMWAWITPKGRKVAEQSTERMPRASLGRDSFDMDSEDTLGNSSKYGLG